MADTLRVTPHGEFYRAIDKDEVERFFAAPDANTRELARAADANGDPVTVKGFAVYDTTVATEYAIALYPTNEQAKAHKPAEPAELPTGIFEDTSAAKKASKPKAKGKRTR